MLMRKSMAATLPLAVLMLAVRSALPIALPTSGSSAVVIDGEGFTSGATTPPHSLLMRSAVHEGHHADLSAAALLTSGEGRAGQLMQRRAARAAESSGSMAATGEAVSPLYAVWENFAGLLHGAFARLASLFAATEEASPWNAGISASSASMSDACPLPPGAIWCQARSGSQSWQMALYPVLADGRQDAVSATICSSSFWEFKDPESWGVSEPVSRDLVLLDIGANVGWYTFMFASHGHRVIAVEPMAANRAMMQATLCRNPELASRVRIVPAALAKAASPGQSCGIFSAAVNLGDGILACTEKEIAEVKANTQFHHIEREKVPLMTLDMLLAEQQLGQDVFGDRIDAVKVDVEGQECNALAGGTQMFARFHPKYIMVESRFGDTFDCVVRSVDPHGEYAIRTGNFTGPLSTYAELAATGRGTANVFFTAA
mmetsp:Transcript_35997/g.65528  ORF Transcript_35997/g.65528 Transcript_35997/m.65528 type:complete len:431 (-) Transcript_35997:6-1298(-)